MDTEAPKKNCGNDLPQVCIDWDGWFLDKLWGSNGWLTVARSLMELAFPNHDFPAVPQPPRRMTGSVRDNGVLKTELQRSTTLMLQWSRGVTLQVQAIHRELLAAGHPDSAQLTMHLNEQLRELQAMSRIPNPGSSNAPGMCGPFAGWARKWNRWAINTRAWELLAAGARRQVPPPPWPPWPRFQDELPDSDGLDPNALVGDDERPETF